MNILLIYELIPEDTEIYFWHDSELTKEQTAKLLGCHNKIGNTATDDEVDAETGKIKQTELRIILETWLPEFLATQKDKRVYSGTDEGKKIARNKNVYENVCALKFINLDNLTVIVTGFML